jgi:hypothetical protein
MKSQTLFLIFLLLNISSQNSLRFLKEELLEEKQADTFMALPWGIYSSITHVKEDGVLLIKLFGTQATGNDWRLINAEEMKEKWGFEALNLDENKSGPYFGIDNISGSRRFHHKGVWKFLVKVGKEIPNGEHGSIKFKYSPSFGTENPDQHMDVHVVVVKPTKPTKPGK